MRYAAKASRAIDGGWSKAFSFNRHVVRYNWGCFRLNPLCMVEDMTIRDFIYKVSNRPPFKRATERRLQKRIYRQACRVVSADPAAPPEKVALPGRFGRGLSERVIELILARLAYAPGLEVLDVGHANAQLCHRRMITSLPGPRKLTGLDIAEPRYDASFYQESVLASATDTPFEDARFDLIWCISALEHFGMDNSDYAEEFEIATEAGTDSQALAEMMRILKPGGTLLVTVPYGRYENLGWVINYDAGRWQELLRTVREQAEIAELYFKHDTQRGWLACLPEALRDTGYWDQRNHGAAGLAACLIRKR